MTTTKLLSELERGGVELQAHGDLLRLRPKEAVTPELVEILRARKPEIIRLLARSQVETGRTGKSKCHSPEKCAGCYPIHGGRYLYPPKPSQSWLGWLRKWQPKEGNPVQ